MSIAKQLKKLRKEKKITQKQLAEQTGIPFFSLSNYELGRREPNSKAMAALEQYFNVSGAYLRGESDMILSRDGLNGLNDGLQNISSSFSLLAANLEKLGKDDVSAEAVQVIEQMLFYVNLQAKLATRQQTTYSAFLKLLESFSILTPPQADEAARIMEAFEKDEENASEETLVQKYRQLDQRGQAAVLDNLQREYDYLYSI